MDILVYLMDIFVYCVDILVYCVDILVHCVDILVYLMDILVYCVDILQGATGEKGAPGSVGDPGKKVSVPALCACQPSLSLCLSCLGRSACLYVCAYYRTIYKYICEQLSLTCDDVWCMSHTQGEKGDGGDLGEVGPVGLKV